MTRKKLEIISDEEVEQEPRTRPVRVHETRSYVEEQPIESEIVESTEESFPDPFAMFNEIITTNQQASMRVWRLPNYEIDGRASSAGTEREYCGSIPYEADNMTMLDQIQQKIPMGGTVQLELYADGRIQKRGLLKLIKQAQPISGAYTPSSVVIHNPAAPQQQAVTPMAAMKEQAESFLAVANVIKQLQPEHVAPMQVEPPEPVSIKDKILEGVIMQAFSGDKVPADRFDRVLEVLGGGKPETSWLDSLMQGIGPHVGPLLQQVGPGLNALFLRLATGAPVEVPPVPVQATSGGVLPDGSPAPEVAPDPAEYAWRRVLMRILDDCFEHAQATARGALGIDVHSSAEAIVDLGSRFSENPQIVGTIESLLAASPEQVIALCATMVPPQLVERVSALAQSTTALVWLGELQVETRAILAGDDAPAEVTGDENKAGD